jgi:hypothetical protein
MKKIISIVSLVCLFFLDGTAQTKSVDIDNVNYSYSYRNLPAKPINPIDFKYTTKVNATGVVKNNISIENVNDALLIAGQVKVENPEEALFSIELTLGNIIVVSSSVAERKEDHKDKAGKVTSTSYYYRSVIEYTFDASGIFRNGQEVLRNGSLYSRQEPLKFTSREYGTRKQAADYWNNNKESLISEFYREHSLKSASILSNNASIQYGFNPIKARDIVKTIDEKKHNENETFRAAADSLKAELEKMTPDIPLNREKIEGLINYFKSIPEKYADPKHKADIRLRYAAWYNLCKIYLYLDEPDNVAQYANKIASNGYDDKDGGRLLKEANELKADFDRTNIRTRHFNPDVYFAPQEPETTE